MRRTKPSRVRDARRRSLPRRRDIETVLYEFARRVNALSGNRDRVHLEPNFLTPLRSLAAAALTERMGIAGPVNLTMPERPVLTVELPYLERNENIDALTIACCIKSKDGAGEELYRTTLEDVLLGILETGGGPIDLDCRLKVIAAELRALAARLDERIDGAERAGRRPMLI